MCVGSLIEIRIKLKFSFTELYLFMLYFKQVQLNNENNSVILISTHSHCIYEEKGKKK